MHSFLRAVGFSDKHLSEYEVSLLLDDICQHYESKVAVIGKDITSAFLELSRSFGSGFGIRVCGEQDAHGFHRINYFPYLTGGGVTSEENVAIQLRAAGDSYSGVLEDGRVGMSLIFALQNPGDYRRELRLGRLEEGRVTTTLSALSLSGMVILPIRADAEPEEQRRDYYEKRVKMVAEAKSGDERAIERLTLQDMDLYTMLQKRVEKEDVLSIVETYFMPYGMECDQYKILGTILDVREEKNVHTQEQVVILSLLCNGMALSVCINRGDLTGEPAPGRRFKGNIWLQGRVNFRTKSPAANEIRT